MSDRSPEDEIVDEARKFSASMQAAMRRYAQAANWLERRRARREISLITRQEARDQQAARQRNLVYSEQAVDKFRVHALAVSQRANDPTVDHARRFRDQQVLVRHQADMRDLLLRNPHLTEVEKGIALDGLDAATTFPEFETGRLFNRAHKVKGIEALRYRAQVARTREATGIERATVFTEQARAVMSPPREREQIAQPFTSTRVQAEAIQGLRRAQLEWSVNGDTATARGRDELIGQWRQAARNAERAGLSTEQIEHEFANAEANSRYVAQVHSLNHPDAAWRHTYSYHPSETDAAAWADQQVRESNWVPGVQLRADVHKRGNRDAPLRFAQGGLKQVAARTGEWADRDRDRDSGRDLAGELDSLTTRHTLSIQHNADLADNNARLTRKLTAMTAERDQLLAERVSEHAVPERDSAPTRGEYEALVRKVDDLTEQYQQVDGARRTAVDDLSALRAEHAKVIGQLTAERDNARALADQRLRERDEAVAKVAEMTPPEQRLGAHPGDRNGPERPQPLKRPEMAGAPSNGAERPDIGDGFDR
ncbi:hypothetical protein [Nocardia sp. CA-120079]|uniref:hypothetical protein n=1 Tax=Nocardia sp. CA-120079 TaxID=3239974 RepID=UPI003D987B6D